MHALLDAIEARLGALRGKGNGWYSIDKEVKSAVSLIQDRRGTIIDVGGNAGEYSARIRALLPDAEIHVFEPSRTNIDKLRKRFASDAKVVLQPYALSDRVSSAVLYADAPGSGLGSLTQRQLAHHGLEFKHSETVEAIRFEDYWKAQLGSRRIAFAKIDVEGHELTVLRGFGDAINHVDLVQFEFGGTCIDTRIFLRDFWYFFKEHDFEIYRITPFRLQHLHKYSEADECFITTNFLAKSRRV